MDVVHEAGLSRKVARMRPIGVIKGNGNYTFPWPPAMQGDKPMGEILEKWL